AFARLCPGTLASSRAGGALRSGRRRALAAPNRSRGLRRAHRPRGHRRQRRRRLPRRTVARVACLVFAPTAGNSGSGAVVGPRFTRILALSARSRKGTPGGSRQLARPFIRVLTPGGTGGTGAA